jgi:hypothetical protein
LIAAAGLALGLLLATAGPDSSVLAPAAVAGPAMTAKVTYLAGASVYIDAGRSEGLLEGDTLEVQRSGSRVALLSVNFLASHRATCVVLGDAPLPSVGDAIRFLAHGASAPPPPPAAGLGALQAAALPVVPTATRARPAPWLRGRAGVRYLGVRTEGGSHFEQPMLDLRAETSGSGPLDATLDLRGRRTSQSYANGDVRQETYSRVYRALLTWHDPKAQRLLTVGRQSSGAIGPVSLFDGALLQTGADRWRAGVFAGTQPEPLHMRLSGDVSQYGVFLERRQAPLAARRWSLGLGAISSYDHASPDRDFAYLQGSYRDSRLSGYFSQETDFNRAWKRSQGESGVSLTSTFASARLALTDDWDLNTGYDNRRNVRLWRDRETAETQFDDRYRQGAWAGMGWHIANRLRLGGELRSNGGGFDRADSWSTSADLHRIGARGLSLRARYAQYRSDPNDSRLASYGVALDPLPAAHLSWTFGERHLSQPQFGLETSTRWQSVGLDYTFLRRWYATVSFERDRGDSEDMTQFDAGLSRRF